jgi:hypothetical protein
MKRSMGRPSSSPPPRLGRRGVCCGKSAGLEKLLGLEPVELKARLRPRMEGCEAQGSRHHLDALPEVLHGGHHKSGQVVSGQIEAEAGGQVDGRGYDHPGHGEVVQDLTAKLLGVALASCDVEQACSSASLPGLEDDRAVGVLQLRLVEMAVREGKRRRALLLPVCQVADHLGTARNGEQPPDGIGLLGA